MINVGDDFINTNIPYHRLHGSSNSNDCAARSNTACYAGEGIPWDFYACNMSDITSATTQSFGTAAPRRFRSREKLTFHNREVQVPALPT